ncbi:MAG: SAM-dependent methyltransferase [Candidatus Moranbacteria bacterium CG_4_9_14_3_um_filter_40_7]|nr:MAG: SAM-dependent methyltransferase [Candidatus Moranbacteria bacterium CG_4_9_14_3_um_filter_40_7]
MTNQKLANEIINKIFRDPEAQYGLKEFDVIRPDQVLEIFEKEKGKFYIKCLKRDKDILLFNEEKNLAKPEEIIRQLWIQKLLKYYNYPLERIDVEKDIRFGHEIHAKAADIVIYQKDKETPLIIIETKNPSEKKGLDQLKTYINSEGAPIGVWSNGAEKVILYRPYPREYQALRDIPKVDQKIEDVLEEKLTLDKLETKYDLVRIIKILEELVLANAGQDSFSEIFKLIYAKLFDEKEARKREENEVLFRQSKDPNITYDVINKLFLKAVQEWPGIFSAYEKVELSPSHLDVCISELQKIKLLNSNLEVIDTAFEYLLPDVAKGKRGQYFTPRHAIDMAVKMLDPRDGEYIIDPACGSGGFLIHAMNYTWNHDLRNSDRSGKTDYAKKYIYGIDFDDKPTKIARAMMLIAGDGKSHILRLNSLNPKEWQGEDREKERARAELRDRLHKFEDYDKNKFNQENFKYFDFDMLLSNPPFAGEIHETSLLREYELAKNDKGKLRNKMERHILFIERSLDLIKPGGRMAIVLPQGVLNNTQMEYVRDYLLEKAKILAVVGLHGNTFKPHTGTKTSILFMKKWDEKEKIPQDYPIFMAVSKKGGKDTSGEYIYKKDKDGNVLYDVQGKKILDHDLDEIAEEFLKFMKK